MVDVVVICVEVPSHFDKLLQPGFEWRIHTERIGPVYVVSKPYVRYEYRPLHRLLLCRFSAPRIIHGNNWTLLHPDDWPLVVAAVNGDMRSTFSWIGPHPLQWSVCHIEYPLHMRVSPGQKQPWLDLLAELRLPYLRPNTTYQDKGSVYQQNGSRQFITYDKGRQVEQHQGISVPGLEDVLRLEVRFKNAKSLKRQMDHWAGVNLPPILGTAVLPAWITNIQGDVRHLVNEVASAPTMDDAKNRMQAIGWSNAKISHYETWLLEVATKGPNAVFIGNRQAYYRRKKALASIGLSMMLDSGLEPPVWIEPQRVGTGGVAA